MSLTFLLTLTFLSEALFRSYVLSLMFTLTAAMKFIKFYLLAVCLMFCGR